MEQQPKQKGATGAMAAAWLVAAVVLLSVFFRMGENRDVQAWAVDAGQPARLGSSQRSTLHVGDRVVPLGRAVGIKLFSDGVLVVGLSPVETQQGALCPGRECGLKTGDVITHVDGREVDTVEQIQSAVKACEGQRMVLQTLRGEKSVQLSVEAVENRNGVYQLGVWLRDSMAGIGTMTFYDPNSGIFAALGHGVNDVDTGMLMPLESGGIMSATVEEVQRGEKGNPGQLQGQFDLTKDLGQLYANTDSGVFGRLVDPNAMSPGESMEIASREQVRTGPAEILSNVSGGQVERFAVEITHVSGREESTRNLMLHVTDPRLLEATGGIVQGMSGSPILQNGRIVGAVTHVLVNDPTRGYGIFIENMLRAAA